MQQATPSATEKQFFGHPRGLATLFFTEMWERFSYYGLRGLLVLYLTATLADGGMELTDATAGAILGLYTAAVYLLALPGGWIADRVLGQRSAVFWGGVIIAAGHFSMAMGSDTLFFFGLALVATGTGLLKPNVSAMVGDLYADKGARRDAGFSIFYMGINLGAFLGPIICGYLGEGIDWHLGFGAAGVGMVLGLIQYRMGDAYLLDAGQLEAEALSKKPAAVRGLMLGLAACAVLLAVGWFLDSSGTVDLSAERIAGGTGVFIVSIAILYFVYLMVLGGLAGDEKEARHLHLHPLSGCGDVLGGIRAGGLDTEPLRRTPHRPHCGLVRDAGELAAIRKRALHHHPRSHRRVALGLVGQPQPLHPRQVRDGVGAPWDRLSGSGLGGQFRHARESGESHVAGGDVLLPHRG